LQKSFIKFEKFSLTKNSSKTTVAFALIKFAGRGHVMQVAKFGIRFSLLFFAWSLLQVRLPVDLSGSRLAGGRGFLAGLLALWLGPLLAIFLPNRVSVRLVYSVGSLGACAAGVCLQDLGECPVELVFFLAGIAAFSTAFFFGQAHEAAAALSQPETKQGFFRVRACGTAGFACGCAVLALWMPPGSIGPYYCSCLCYCLLAMLPGQDCIAAEAPAERHKASRRCVIAKIGRKFCLVAFLCASLPAALQTYSVIFLRQLIIKEMVFIPVLVIELALLIGWAGPMSRWSLAVIGPGAWGLCYLLLAWAGAAGSSAAAVTGLLFSAGNCLFQTELQRRTDGLVQSPVEGRVAQVLICLLFAAGSLAGVLVSWAAHRACCQATDVDWALFWALAAAAALACFLLAIWAIEAEHVTSCDEASNSRVLQETAVH
jgi:hypothetical protein